MGITVSLFVVFLVLTGWALNHTAELGLARISVHTPWITAWYGLRGEVPTTGRPTEPSRARAPYGLTHATGDVSLSP